MKFKPENEPVQVENGQGKFSWKSPSNIALIKYWGKHGVQLPKNPSLSFTLRKSLTETTIEYKINPDFKLTIDFSFEGQKKEAFAKKIISFLNSVKIYYPFLNNCHLKIESSNTFPHSSGIASSASSMSALALGLTSIEAEISNNTISDNDFFRKASFISRLGSGSASRSVYGGYNVWGYDKSFPGSSDDYAIPVNDIIHADFRNLADAILIAGKSKKSVSSTAGHQLMKGHPYAESRFKQARENIANLKTALQEGNWPSFIEIVENEALSLHAMMLTSSFSYLLLKPQSVSIIENIKVFREQNNIPVCFTIDAGPNIHMIYPAEFGQEVKQFINNKLLEFCEESMWIDDMIGEGPELI